MINVYQTRDIVYVDLPILGIPNLRIFKIDMLIKNKNFRRYEPQRMYFLAYYLPRHMLTVQTSDRIT